MGLYQGEPMEKERIKTRFFEVLENSSDPQTAPELNSMSLIFQSVMQIKW
jgi:hypothetical protein